MKIELSNDEVTTIMVALDNYRNQKELEAMESLDPQLTEDAGSAEWCWQKMATAQVEFNRLDSRRRGLSKTNNPITASVDPFGLPTWNDT